MLDHIVDIAREAGNKTLDYYHQNEDVEVEYKADDSPVTQADMAAHNIILRHLIEHTPDIPVISEEGSYIPENHESRAAEKGARASELRDSSLNTIEGIPDYSIRRSWEKFWIVDPLDGTKEFINKNGQFTINIALIKDGEPVIGVVYAPDQDLFYYAEKGKGTFRQTGEEEPRRIFSEKADPDHPLVIAQSRSHSREDTLQKWLDEYGITIKDRIRAGSSLKFGLVAEGKADIYIRTGPTMEWDVAAGDCVYRNSARSGQHDSALTYNKETMKNNGFVVGL